MDCPCKSSPTKQRNHLNAHSCCFVAFLFNLCIVLLVFGLYVMLCLHNTSGELTSLKLELHELRAKFDSSQSEEQVDNRGKRSVPVRSQLRSSIDRPRRSRNGSRPMGGIWQRLWLRNVSSSLTESPTRETFTSISTTSTPAFTTPSPAFVVADASGELPITAYESDNLVKTPEPQESFNPSGALDARPSFSVADDREAPEGSTTSFDASTSFTSIAIEGIRAKSYGDVRGDGQTVSGGSSSAFTRWGKVTCPQVASLAYAGYAAAANPWYGSGGSTDLECLSTSPSWQSNSATTVQTSSKLFAAKISIGEHMGVFNQLADNAVLTCAVCTTTKSPVITIPGRVECLNGWHREYHGYMMTTSGVRFEMFFSSRNYCVDGTPDYYTGHDDTKGLKLTFLQAGGCYNGLYPCQEYTENHLIACTVCSKYSS